MGAGQNEVLLLIIQTAGLLFVGASIIYAGKSFRLAMVQHQREVRQETYEFVSRLTKDLGGPPNVIRKVDDSELSSEGIRNNHELSYNVSFLLNSLESMAIAVRNCIYDEEIVRASMQYQFV